jgi:hypothetical protein
MNLAGARDSLFHSVWTSSGAHPAFYPMGAGALFLEGKQQRRESDHSPSSAEAKNTWSYTSTFTYVFMAFLLIKYKDNFTFRT